jgi:hypothetical protein
MYQEHGPCTGSKLLEALKEMRRWYGSEYQSNRDIDALADAAIAEAEKE